MTIRVAVLGAKGRMGQAMSVGLGQCFDLELVAALDADDDLARLAEAGVQVAVDFTTAEAARSNLPRLADMGIHAVVGTTGFSAEDLSGFHERYVGAAKSCFIVPNFSIGAVLLMRFAEQAAEYFDGVEIVELHHEHKRDAPSGTAVLTAQRIAAARKDSGAGAWVVDPTESTSVSSVRGGQVDGVPVHSVRLPGYVAHEEVLFGGEGQTLSLRHDSFDRSAYVPGLLRAVRGVEDLPVGLTVGLDAVL